MGKVEMHCPHQAKITDCPECMAILNGPTSKQAGDGQDDASAHAATPTALGQQVASLELCKELYVLSGWKETSFYYIEQGPTEFLADQLDYPTTVIHEDAIAEYPYFKKILFPAYDAGYLLRKLPATVTPIHRTHWVACVMRDDIEDRDYKNEASISSDADTPENALCKLAIELIKQGVIK